MREDWIEIELGSISQIYNGNSINAKVKEEKYQISKTGLNYIGTKDIGFDGAIDYENGVKIPLKEPKFKIAPKNCVLVCSEGGSAGKKTAYTKEDICFGNKLYAIVNKFFVFEGKYVYYYTRYQKFFKYFQNQMNGIIGGVSVKKFSNITIPLAPLLEQKAIVAKIEQLFSELDNAVANLKTAQAKLKIYRQAVLKKAFTKETPDGRFEGELISNLTTKVGSGATPKGGKNVYKDSGIPLIRSMNIHFDRIKYDEMAYIDDEQAKKLDNVEVKKDDVLLNITGASIGRVNIAPENLDGARVNQHVSILRLKQELMFPKFLKYYIESPDLQNWITKENYGTTRQALTKTMILNMSIPCPSIEEQNQIVQEIESRLSVCDKIEETIGTSLTKSEALRQSILKKAFDGKLLSEQELKNIKNHPEYESAEALLKRIKNERDK